MLRDYQINIRDGVYAAWRAGARNVLAVAPTGAGKTKIKAAIAREMGVPFCAIAHRQELVSQISIALALEGVRHRIIAPKAVVSFIVTQHIKRTGTNYYNPNADVGVAGVDTLIRAKAEDWLKRVQVWDIDEAHHCLPTNKWGEATRLFPHALGLGVTATPIRADRKPLGRVAGGLFDDMVIGPSMRELIGRGYLSDYRVFVPPQSINTSGIESSGTTGDYNLFKLREASHQSTITGDIVRDYLRFAPGKLGISFVVDVETANQVAEAFRQKGIPAESVNAKTPDNIRQELIDRFARGDIKQLVNVDLFGEGMDVPGVECVSMGRPTQSYGLYVQQFGRALRISPGKSHAIIIDHVGNVVTHNLPDKIREWSLNDVGRTKKKNDDEIPLRVCTECFFPYEAFLKVCPNCGHVHKVEATNRTIEQVEGDLIELSPEILAKLRGEVQRIDGEPLYPLGATQPVIASIGKMWDARKQAQTMLRHTISNWAGVQRHVNKLDDSEIYRKFWHLFGTDIMSAQTLGASDALTLNERIRNAKG